MSSTRVVKRVLLLVLLALAGILCLAKIRASATPIRPDIQKIVSQPQRPAAEFPPARAGWNGPEAASNKQNPNPTLEKIGPEASVRIVRQSLLSAAIPDPKILALIALVILLLRRIRKYTTRQPAGVSAASSNTPVLVDSPPAGVELDSGAPLIIDPARTGEHTERSRPAA